MQAVTWSRWKLIHNRKFDLQMLFNLDEDPGESRTVNEDNPEILQKLAAILAKWSDDVERKSRGVKVSAPEFSPEEIERLRSLGYVQ
jgi:hypothetical protein